MQFTLHVSEFVPQAITLDESLCSVEKGWKCLFFEKYSLPTHIFQVFKAPTACRFLVINNVWHPRYGLLLTSDQINLGLSENSILPTWVYISPNYAIVVSFYYCSGFWARLMINIFMMYSFVYSLLIIHCVFIYLEYRESRIQYCKNEPLHAYAFAPDREIQGSNAVGYCLIFARECTLMGMHTGQPITWPCLCTIDYRIRYRFLIVQPPPRVACFGMSSDHFRTGYRTCVVVCVPFVIFSGRNSIA